PIVLLIRHFMDFREENIDWQCPAGRRLDDLARRLPPRPSLEITVFGSAPLQLFVEHRFLSADRSFRDRRSDGSTYRLRRSRRMVAGKIARILYPSLRPTRVQEHDRLAKSRDSGPTPWTPISFCSSMGHPCQQTATA